MTVLVLSGGCGRVWPLLVVVVWKGSRVLFGYLAVTSFAISRRTTVTTTSVGKALISTWRVVLVALDCGLYPARFWSEQTNTTIDRWHVENKVFCMLACLSGCLTQGQHRQKGGLLTNTNRRIRQFPIVIHHQAAATGVK